MDTLAQLIQRISPETWNDYDDLSDEEKRQVGAALGFVEKLMDNLGPDAGCVFMEILLASIDVGREAADKHEDLKDFFKSVNLGIKGEDRSSGNRPDRGGLKSSSE